MFTGRFQKREQSEAKIQAALDSMRESLSTDEFRPWNQLAIVKTFKIGGSFPTVLHKMGAVELDYGTVKLTPKMAGLRASTVRKHMNEYANKNNKAKKVRATKGQPELVFPEASRKESKSDIKEVVVALKKQLREEILQELLAGLSK